MSCPTTKLFSASHVSLPFLWVASHSGWKMFRISLINMHNIWIFPPKFYLSFLRGGEKKNQNCYFLKWKYFRRLWFIFCYLGLTSSVGKNAKTSCSIMHLERWITFAIFDSVAGGGQEFCSLPLADYGSTYVGVCFRTQYEISRLRILLRAQAFEKTVYFPFRF